MRYFFFIFMVLGVVDVEAQISKAEFRQVISLIRQEFSSLSQVNNRKLKFFTDYESDWAQAFARRWEDDEIHIYGGFAKIRGATQDSLALIVCHELGHLHGGSPYSNVDLKLSVEGKSDYWATNVCLPKMIPLLKARSVTDASLSLCSDEICARTLDAALVVTHHFARDDRGEKPSLLRKDPTVVTEILKTHPSAQCRLDTLVAGFFYEVYPACWMVEIK